MAAMNGYKARKAPNVSHYLANLNAIPSAHDVATQQDEFNIEDELAQFTNTEFLDFDAEGMMEQPMPPEYDPSLEEKARRENAAAHNKISGKGMDLVTSTLYAARASNASTSILRTSTKHFILLGLNVYDSPLTQSRQATTISPAWTTPRLPNPPSPPLSRPNT